MTTPSPHAWLRPKLAALLAEAAVSGIARDVCVAVITDLVNGPLAGAPDARPEEGWNQDIGEPLSMVNGPPDTAPDQSAGEAENNPLDHVSYRGV